MPAVFDKINLEFAQIGKTVENLALSLARRAKLSPPADSNDYFEDVAIFASSIEHIYSGCERVMEIAARDIDGHKIEHAANWHRDVLDRMALPFGARRAIITPECRAALDRLRAFRHRERTSYIEELDRSIVIDRAKEALDAFALLEAAFAQFEAEFPTDVA